MAPIYQTPEWPRLSRRWNPPWFNSTARCEVGRWFDLLGHQNELVVAAAALSGLPVHQRHLGVDPLPPTSLHRGPVSLLPENRHFSFPGPNLLRPTPGGHLAEAAMA
ncbi:hypothetical protein MRX96_057618 [Rhipicephalus microplus]